MGVQALRSSSRVVASSAVSTLPFLVVVDLNFRELGALGRRGARKERGVRKRIPLVESLACRASVFEQSGGSDEVEKSGSEVGKSGSEVGKRSRDAFRSAIPQELVDDEFFARMNMAMEASRQSSSRASSTSPSAFFEGSSLNAACEPARPSAGEPPKATSSSSPAELCEVPRGGVQLPSSIQKLRRRKGEPRRESAGCAIKRAFSSMVYMIKALQSHALQIRQVMFSESWDVQEVLHLVHKEVHSSFVWLFQRVFACTPKLMLSVMILLANFTVFSVGENLAIAAVTDTPPAISQFIVTHGNPQSPNVEFANGPRHSSVELPGPSMSVAGAGGNSTASGFPVAEGFDDDDDDSWLKEQVQLAQEIETRKLVAPHLEADDYGCFDRTDLDYQLAIAEDPFSSVLLANYAQFLFVVRGDHDRAEKYFHRATEADPRDSTILDRFASFLWLGRRDRGAAERVYKAAMAADPECSYNAGSYAHFLWHAGDNDSIVSHGRPAT